MSEHCNKKPFVRGQLQNVFYVGPSSEFQNLNAQEIVDYLLKGNKDNSTMTVESKSGLIKDFILELFSKINKLEQTVDSLKTQLETHLLQNE